MKNMKKLRMCVLGLCSFFLFSCGSDDDPGISGLQNDYLDVAGGEFVAGELPVGDNDLMLQSATFDGSALPGGSSFLVLQSTEELSEVNLTVQGQTGYIRVPLSNPEIVSAKVRSASLYEYQVLVMISQHLDGDFTIEFTTVNKNGEVSSKVTRNVSYVEAGTGSLQVNLRFSNAKDVDLYVVEPNGNVIYYGMPFPYYSENYQAYMGWEYADTDEEPEWDPIGLDVDSNAGCNIDNINSENIFFDEACLQKGTYEVWVNMYSNCDPSTPTGYAVLANYKGSMISNSLGENPVTGEFPVNEPDNPIDEELTGARKVMEFTINEGRNPGRSRISEGLPVMWEKGVLNRLMKH